MRVSLRFFIFVFACFCVGSGCASTTKDPLCFGNREIITTNHGVKIPLYNANPEERYWVEKHIAMMTEKTQRSITLIRFVGKDEKHFKVDAEAAHCEDNRHICIRSERFRPIDVNHEAAHALTYDLPSTSLREWEAIAGEVYGDNHYQFGHFYPINGLLDHYASRSAWEDIAIWVGSIYSAISNDYYGIFRRIEKDPRYLRKLDFLLKWEYIDQTAYDKIKPLLR